MMNKKALSIIGVSCFGAVLFAGSMFGGNTAEAGLNDYGKVSEYSKVLADNYQSVNDYYIETLSVDGLSDNQKKEYLTRDDVYAVGNNIVISKEEVQQYTDFYLHDGESEADAHQLAVKDAMDEMLYMLQLFRMDLVLPIEEIQEWLTELRTIVGEQIQQVYIRPVWMFCSEEAYWAYES